MTREEEYRDALVAIAKLASDADRFDVWDHLDHSDFLKIIPSSVYEYIEAMESLDEDDLI